MWEFLEEYRWESSGGQLALVRQEPQPTGYERWEPLLAALAEHLTAGLDAASPLWAELRVLRRPWFSAELAIQRAGPLVWAPAAFRNTASTSERRKCRPNERRPARCGAWPGPTPTCRRIPAGSLRACVVNRAGDGTLVYGLGARRRSDGDPRWRCRPLQGARPQRSPRHPPTPAGSRCISPPARPFGPNRRR